MPGDDQAEVRARAALAAARRAALSRAVEWLLVGLHVAGLEQVYVHAGDDRDVVYARSRVGQVAITLTGGMYRWRDREGRERRLPWSEGEQAARQIVGDLIAQLRPSGLDAR